MFRNRRSSDFDFNRIDVTAMHVIPIFDKKRGIALHAAASRIDPIGASRVPFFLMPTVGGADSLRGYREFRFRDAAAITLNAEYRWEAFSGLDLALFVDAGDVGPTWRSLVGSRLRSSWGGGLPLQHQPARVPAPRRRRRPRRHAHLGRHGPGVPPMTGRRRLLAAAAVVALALGALGRSASPTYYPDDPLAVDPETRDAAGVSDREISDPYDFVENTFLKPGDRTDQRAVNVNTADEVPDSSWFTNRVGRRTLTIDEYVRGPNVSGPPAPGPWTVVSGKSDGITPGFTVRDAAGTLWFIKFDPPSNPEMATGAEVISTKLFWALGYHVPENYLAVLDPAQLVVGDGATYRDTLGVRRPLTRADRRRVPGQGRPPRRRPLPRHRQPRAAGPAGRARSSISARGSTTRTTSSRTNTGASCADCAPSRPG